MYLLLQCITYVCNLLVNICNCRLEVFGYFSFIRVPKIEFQYKKNKMSHFVVYHQSDSNGNSNNSMYISKPSPPGSLVPIKDALKLNGGKCRLM